MTKFSLPEITDREWRAIQKHIPLPRRGPKPRNDRQILAAVCYAQAARVSVEALPGGFPPVASIRTRVLRWRQADVLDAIIAAAAPAVRRIADDYANRLSDLSPWGSDWKYGRAKDDPVFTNLPRR